MDTNRHEKIKTFKRTCPPVFDFCQHQRFDPVVSGNVKSFMKTEDVKCQILLGKDDFVAKFKNHLKGNDNLEEIPKSQRYMGRPLLGDIFKKEVDKNINKRNRLIFDSVEKHGYSQKEIADYLNMHYSTISRVMKDINMSKYKT